MAKLWEIGANLARSATALCLGWQLIRWPDGRALLLLAYRHGSPRTYLGGDTAEPFGWLMGRTQFSFVSGDEFLRFFLIHHVLLSLGAFPKSRETIYACWRHSKGNTSNSSLIGMIAHKYIQKGGTQGSSSFWESLLKAPSQSFLLLPEALLSFFPSNFPLFTLPNLLSSTHLISLHPFSLSPPCLLPRCSVPFPSKEVLSSFQLSSPGLHFVWWLAVNW